MASVPVTFVGYIHFTDLGVGGGPMPPGAPPGAHPMPPIYIPVDPGYGQPTPPDMTWGGRPPPGSISGGPDWLPKPPLGIWGGGNEGFPTHPIVIPPGFIDGVHPSHPIVIPPPAVPGHPAHPIVIPPEVWPPDARPEHPIVIPPPPVVYPPRPTHPIVLPEPPTDGKPPVIQILENWDVVATWTPEGGWGTSIVPSGDQPVVTPSSGRHAGPPKP